MSETPSNPVEFVAPSIEELAPLFPAYQIDCFIAQGGMGAVYRATQKSLDRPVAIKILPKEFGADEGFRASFEAEAKAMAKLNHPNLIGVYDFGDIDGMLFIVMEFVEGKALYYSVHGKVIDPQVAFEMVSTISKGLAHAHTGGILHRDIKPANILLDLEANPKIGDFGLARPLDQDRSGGVVFGTPGYTAPEVYNHAHPVDQRSDIFSIGALLFELLSGKPPVADSTGMTIGSDPRIDAILKKATHEDPAQRYADAKELAAELDNLSPNLSKPLFAAPTKSGPLPALATPALASSKNSSLLPLFIILLLLGGGGAFAYFKFVNKDEPTDKPVAEEPEKKEVKKPEKVVDKGPKKPKPNSNKPRPPKRDTPNTPPEPEKVVKKETPFEALQRLRKSLVAGERSEFPPGTKKHNGSAYFFARTPMNWHTANHLASSFGANLAVLTNAEALKWANATFKSESPIWVGASDSGWEEKWHWLDGTVVDSSTWTSGEPNNSTSTDPAGEDFAALSHESPSLVDLVGSAKLPFIIEWKLDGKAPASLEAQLARTGSALSNKQAPVFPAGSVNVDGSRFLLVRKTLSWTAASDFASSGGGHLAVLSNENEAAFVNSLLGKIFKEWDSCWIGARRNEQDREVWENVTEESFDFVNWLPQQPDDFGDGEDFVTMRKLNGQIGANDESGGGERSIKYFLIEWSHPSQRNFSKVAEAPKKKLSDIELAFAKLREEIVDKHGRDYARFRKKHDDIIEDFVEDSVAAVIDLDDRLTPDQQEFIIARLKEIETSGKLPEMLPVRTPKRVQRFFEDAQSDAKDLWESYEEDYNEALTDYFELLNEESRDAFKQGNQVLGQALKLETAVVNEDDDRFHQILNGDKVPLPTEKKEEEEDKKEEAGGDGN